MKWPLQNPRFSSRHKICDPRCLTKSVTLVPLQNPQPPSRHKIYPVAPQEGEEEEEEEEEEEQQQQEICFLQKQFSTLTRSCQHTKTFCNGVTAYREAARGPMSPLTV